MQEMYAVMGQKDIYGECWASLWIVAVYPERDVAEQHCRLANGRSSNSRLGDPSPYDVSLECTQNEGGNDMPMYRVVVVPLVRHVDEYIEVYTKE